MQKLKNNEARPKFTGSYKKKRILCLTSHITSFEINLFIIFVFTVGVTNYFLVFKGHVVTLQKTHLGAL